MTPMIDVVFLLLIFFLCTANFQVLEELLPTNLLAQGAIAADLPPNLEVEELEEVIVKVARPGGRTTWTINDNRYTRRDEVRDVLFTLGSLESALPVLLDVDGDVPLGDVIDLYDLCRLAGFDQVQFAASVGAE